MDQITIYFILFSCICLVDNCKYSKFHGMYEYVSFVNSSSDFEYSSIKPNTGFMFRSRSFIKVYFNVFNTSFRILAKRIHDVPIDMDANIKIYDNVGSRQLNWRDMSNVAIYEGMLIDKIVPKFNGYIRKGIFQSIIHMDEEIYDIEPLDYLNECPQYNAIAFKKPKILKRISEFNGDLINTRKIFHDTITRKIRSKVSTWANKVCMMEIVSDHTFYEALDKNEADVIAEMLFVVREANEIFQQIDFNDDGILDNVGLRIEEIAIYKSKDAVNYTTGYAEHDAKKYMSELTRRVQEHCLSYTFTHIDFKNAIIGQAYAASSNPQGPPGGICEKPIEKYGRLFSYNVGFVTSLNNGTQMSRVIFVETFAHEVGHSFGSHHDREDVLECAPGFEEGNYIMATTSNDGSKPNHRKFSPCSINQISAVLGKRGKSCLIAYNQSVCGNGITEEGEECDCGTYATCDRIDHCCAPRGGYGSDEECTIKRSLNYVCSPRESPCCTKNCQIVSDKNHTCGSSLQECEGKRFCDGKSQRCPKGVPKPDGTTCKTNSRVCSKGFCNQSVCVFSGLIKCQCKQEDKLCDICCKEKYSSNCQSVTEFGIFTDEGKLYKKHPGEYCMGTHAVCNRQHECVENYEEDQMMIETFNAVSTSRFFDFIVDNWFYIFLIIFAIIFVLYGIKTYSHSTTNLVRNFHQCVSEVKKQCENRGGNEDRLENLSRLVTLFPTVSQDYIWDEVMYYKQEFEIVINLLQIGYPIRTVFVPK